MTLRIPSRVGAPLTRFATVGAALSIAACGGKSGGTTTPTSTIAIALASPSGDNQAAKVGQVLPDPLRVRVTKDGVPFAGQTVGWTASVGTATLNPASGATDAQGIATTMVTIGGTTAGALTFVASTSGAASSATFSASAIAATGTVQVGASGSSFTPASITITAGGSVTFNWPAGASQHNIKPDGGTIPSEPTISDGPHQINVTFASPGTYNYHCEVHGSAGGGMHGTVTVVP